MVKQQQGFIKNMIKYVFLNQIEEESSDDEENRIRLKYNSINKHNTNLNEINYLTSEHIKGL